MNTSTSDLALTQVETQSVDISPTTRVGKFGSTSFWLKLSELVNANWFRCLLLALVGVLVHLPALQGERIWDDHYLAHDNPFIKSPLLILESFRHYLFLDSFSAHYRPVQNISFMADYFLWNTNEFGFHLTNVLLHVGSGIVLYFLLRQLFGSLLLGGLWRPFERGEHRYALFVSHASFLVALLWTVHPVHSAAIDYISGRADSLAFLFSSIAWLLFLRASKSKRGIGRFFVYIAAAFSALLALCSREIAFVWIVLFVAHLLWVNKVTPVRLRIGAVICCCGLVLAYIGLRHLPAPRPVLPSTDGWSAPVRVMLMVRALGDYTRLMVFPSNLHMERDVFNPLTCKSNEEWRNAVGIEYLSILGIVGFAALLGGSIKKGAGQATRLFGAGWFFAGYLPISNVVQLNATVAEHWLYLPSVGCIIFLVGCVIEIPRRFWPAVTGFALLAVVGLSVRSYLRSTDWVTPETFFRRTLAAGGTSARTGLNLGQIYASRGDYAEAEKIFRKVLEIAPDYPIAQNNLASLLAREGKNKEAEELFALLEKNSLKMRTEFPCTWMGAVNLARLRHNAHDNRSAMMILDKAQMYYPEVWELIATKSEILREMKGPDAALRVVENFAEKNWWHHGAALALGRLYAQKGDLALADSALQRASWLDLHDTEALRLMVGMRMRQNKLVEAMRLQRRAVARQPDEPSQYVLLSDILEKMGRNEEARSALAKVSRLRALAQTSPTQSL